MVNNIFSKKTFFYCSFQQIKLNKIYFDQNVFLCSLNIAYYKTTVKLIMKKNENTKDKIIELAEEFILTNGYNNFSYNDISEVIGIKKSSIHYHFKAKEDLCIAFIEKYNERFIKWTTKIENLSCKEKLKKFGDLYISLSHNCTRICPFGMLASEYPLLSTNIKRSLSQTLNNIEKWIQNVLISGKKEENFSLPASVEVTSHIVLNSYSGALKRVRMNNNIDILKSMISSITKLIIKD